MTTMKRSALGLSAAALMALSLSACGGASGAPKDASQQSFCDAWKTSFTAIQDNGSTGDQADQAHKVADQLKKVGTPSDMSADARKGFEIFVDWLGKVSADDVKKMGESTDPSASPFSGDDETKFEAFTAYTGSKCFDMPTDMPTDMSLPTDFPTGVPTQ
ncbi:hypothetical protein [Nocardioides ultimimeridianus]